MIINPYLVQPSGPAYGTLTTAWIAATGETDLTILGALNTLESDMATYGLTAKMKALYPMVGGTSTKHSYNFMNTAQYQLTFNGGWTHSSNGAQGGTNAYANTGLNPSTVLSVSSAHISLYTNTTPDGDVMMGNGALSLFLQNDAGILYGSLATASYISTSHTNSAAFYMVNRLSGSSQKLIKNSSIVASNTATGSSYSSSNILLSSYTTTSAFSDVRNAFTSIGDGYTDTEAANLYTAVQAFQTTLSRQV
jgi:hypothetical protein